MLIVDSLFPYTTPPPNLRVVRGLYLYGPDMNDFLPCGSSSAPGHVEGNMRPIAALVGDSAWRARTAPTLVFEVERGRASGRTPADGSDPAPTSVRGPWTRS